MIEPAIQRGPGPGVDHRPGLDPIPASLKHAVPDLVELRGAVRVGAGRNENPGFLCRSRH